MKLAEGKTKIILEAPGQAGLVHITSKDAITAGDGARRNEIEGKASIATATTCNVFKYLKAQGLPGAFEGPVDATTFAARKCDMIPLEVVTRRLATGSYLRRHPEVSEGYRFEPLKLEFFLKDDANHDPQISEADILARGLLSPAELETVKRQATRCFELLEQAWARQDVTLVDLKVEFGRHGGELLLADVIDNDSWRLWPGGDKAQMKDKQVYRNLQEVTPQALQAVRDNYQWVAQATERFGS
ncbi:MAG: phosphoribosylaminoimidazolesuccinocarboxamide synthase [Candidatus Xenobia bacterium]